MRLNIETGGNMKLSAHRWILSLSMMLIIGFGMIQLINYGRDHTNPPVHQNIVWSDPQTEQLAKVACYDCHSNETVWPWYSNVAPVSWMVAVDVYEGRRRLNFDELTKEKAARMAEEMVETIGENEMPPFQYQILHSESRFSTQERKQLSDGLWTTFNSTTKQSYNPYTQQDAN